METRKLYGSLDSPNTLKVLACLFEHNLDFDFVPINLEGGENYHKSFLSISPFGQVPVFEDGDAIQFETRAIIRSMGHGYSKRLGDKQELVFWDPRGQATVANWIDVEDHKFEPATAKLVSVLSTKPREGLAAAAEAEAELSRVLDVYEARLEKARYLAADKYTIADMLHLPSLHSLMGIDQGKRLIESRPRVSAWCSEILARPAWAKVLEMKLQGR